MIETDAPNHWQQIVTFGDGERLLINNTGLDAPSTRSCGDHSGE
ncbi:MAG: hypothetical protein V7K40_34400 [Nostoc sp.]